MPRIFFQRGNKVELNNYGEKAIVNFVNVLAVIFL